MKPILGITMGDPAGIGAEITVKALQKEELYKQCTPIVFGDYAAIADANRFVEAGLSIHSIQDVTQAKGCFGTIDLMDAGILTDGAWEYKKVNPICGKAAFSYIKRAISCAMQGEIHAVVTGPINKESLNLAGIHYSGHTEIFADLTDTKNYAMVLLTDTLRVIHVTTHVAMRKACDLITKDRVLRVIRLANEAVQMFGIKKPKIAVAGLNAHCSENGLFGEEEAKEIIPAVAAAQAEGICAEGPIPPDTVFVRAVAGEFDIVVAMYHDQGHIPLKLTGFKMDKETGRYTSVSGVNSTVGLPIIRTSVDHGTAFDRAGEGRANEESLLDAMYLAAKMVHYKNGESQ